MSIWDDPALQAPPEADYVKFERVGDGFDGRVESVTKQTFDDGTAAPLVTFVDDATGEVRNWTAGQISAKRMLAELRPGPGDHISVRFTGTTGKFKHIEVTVNARGRGEATAASGARPAPPNTSVNLPTYQPAPPPVYAVNGNGAPAAQQAAPPPAPAEAGPPPGMDPAVWARMDAEQRRQMLSLLGNVPAF